MALVWAICAAHVDRESIIGVHEASNIIHANIDGYVERKNLTEAEVDKLMKTVEPFIYGGTPMIEALNKANNLFAEEDYKHHRKLLFVLSDGEPADGKVIPDLAGVNVASCYITNCPITDPKRLYSEECVGWDKGAKFMYHLSTPIRTQLLPRTIFIKQGWTIDISNNETRLFFQVNHPDIIADLCNLARNVVCSQDALAELLSSISLDMYINQDNEGFQAQKQVGETCYANASGAVLHLAMKRIVGREGGYPDFTDLRRKMVDKYREKGAITLKVLQEMCPQYRLHCQVVNIRGAMEAITAKRPVLAIFSLTDPEWQLFSRFYGTNNVGTLTVSDLDIKKRLYGDKHIGHAVVLTSFNSTGLRFMNSWGTSWGDNGFFRVRSADVLRLEFIDVYWTLNDLKQTELDYYDKFGPEISDRLLKSLKGLNTATYRCPLCEQTSEVVHFSGSLVQAKCPRCLEFYDTKTEESHDLVLNMYLTSLCIHESSPSIVDPRSPIS